MNDVIGISKYAIYDKTVHQGKKMDHRLRESYRFMDFQTNSTCTEISKSLFQKFLLWNDGAFWYNRWDKKFRQFGNIYLKCT